MSLQSLMKNTKHSVFRRISLKRREADGEFETNWYQIPDSDIISFGQVKKSIDDILLNYQSTNGLRFKLSNLQGLYSDIDEPKSIFYNNVSINGAMVKVEAGYKDSVGSELPTESTLFLGVISSDSAYDDKFMVNFVCKQIANVFESFPADQITGLGSTLTASEIVEKVKDYQDANLVYYFRKYFTSTSWNIETSTTYYNMATTTTLRSLSVWELFKDLAVSENYSLFVGNDQTVNFRPKEDLSTTADFHFSGLGDDYPTWGFNIKGSLKVAKNYRKVYNKIIIEYGTATTQFVKNETFAWGDSSSSFKYGVKKYEYKNSFIQTSTVSGIADSIYNEYVSPKDEAKFEAKFIPQLDIGELASLTYRPFVPKYGAQWSNFLWDNLDPSGSLTPALWATRDGYNININNETFQIIEIIHNIDNFVSSFTLREV